MLRIGFAPAANAARLIAATAALLLAACATPSGTPPEDLARLACHNQVGAAWGQAMQLRQSYTDQHGRDVEVWCYGGLLRAHWDVRVGWDTLEGGRTVHHTATIAGCFFDDGQSTGPAVSETADHRFATVEWTNRDPANRHKMFRFSYDFGTGVDTITGTIPGAPPTVKTVRAQPTWEALKTELPFPPD